MFYTHHKRPDRVLEPGGGKRITEAAGYIPADKQIEAFMLAGQRLAAARKELYDFSDGVEDESFYDPTRSPNYDLADASQAGIAVGQVLDAQKKALIAAEEERRIQEEKEFEDFKSSKKSKKTDTTQESEE